MQYSNSFILKVPFYCFYGLWRFCANQTNLKSLLKVLLGCKGSTWSWKSHPSWRAKYASVSVLWIWFDLTRWKPQVNTHDWFLSDLLTGCIRHSLDLSEASLKTQSLHCSKMTPCWKLVFRFLWPCLKSFCRGTNSFQCVNRRRGRSYLICIRWKVLAVSRVFLSAALVWTVVDKCELCVL